MPVAAIEARLGTLRILYIASLVARQTRSWSMTPFIVCRLGTEARRECSDSLGHHLAAGRAECQLQQQPRLPPGRARGSRRQALILVVRAADDGRRSRQESQPGKARVSDSFDHLAPHHEDDHADRERREQVAQQQHGSCTDGEQSEQQHRCDDSDLKMHCSSSPF
jgi:hypothetical protein